MFTIHDKKNAYVETKNLSKSKNYLSSARLTRFIFHVWNFPPLSLKMLQYCSTYSAAFLASAIEHHINYENRAHPKHFWTCWFFQWVNLLWGGSLISPRPTYPLQCCSTAVLKCLTPPHVALQCSVLQCLSAPVLQYCSTEATYPPPCSAAVLQYCSAEVSYPHPSQCCRTVLLYCCSAALLHCCTAALLHTCVAALSYSFQFLPLG